MSFNASHEGITKRNGYVISEQGKPPDFVLEIASYASGNLDATVKRDAYAALGIPEYWRFDPTGEYNGDYLAGDRLEDGRYQPIAIERLSEDLWQGYSQALDVHLQWHKVNPHPYRKGMLDFYDARMDRRLSTMTTELADLYRERALRLVAEARVRELEERLGQDILNELPQSQDRAAAEDKNGNFPDNG